MPDFEPYYLSHFAVLRESRTEYRKHRFPVGAIKNYLCFMLRGRVRFITAAEDITVSPGELFFLPKNQPYSSEWFPDPVCEFYSIGFRFADAADGGFALQKLSDPDGAWKSGFQYICGSPDTPLRSLAAFYELFDRISPHLVPLRSLRTQHSVSPALQIICSTADGEISVPELARLCRMSESAFYQQFRRQTGLTPIEYKNQFRCRTAARLLTTTDYSVETVASLVGYASASGLRRQMIKTLGQTPGELRRKNSDL